MARLGSFDTSLRQEATYDDTIYDSTCAVQIGWFDAELIDAAEAPPPPPTTRPLGLTLIGAGI